MNKYNFKKYISELLDLCEDVGNFQLKEQKNLNVNIKADNSPVTNVDLYSSEMIVEYLTNNIPNDVVISEESEQKLILNNSYWLVDPIDGTKNYISGGNQFCICISYISNGYPVFGIIYVPSSKEFYYAIKGQGCYLKVEGTENIKISNDNKTLSNIFVSSTIRSSVIEILNKNFINSELVFMSSAVKFVRVAEGKGHFSIRLGPTHEWDTAAGQCIIEESGGLFLDKNLQRFSYGLGDNFLNGPFFIVNGDLEMHTEAINQCLSLI